MASRLLILLFFTFISLNLVAGNRNIGCFVEGECALWIDNHNLVAIIDDISTPENCLDVCKLTPECLYFTHFQNTEQCYLYSSCEYFFYECKNKDCISGEASCEHSQDLIENFVEKN